MISDISTGNAASLGFIESFIRQHGSYAGVTRGTSMRPLFKTHRDVVVIFPADEPLSRYDVALYTDKAGKYILHRVIRVNDGGYVIRGDNTFRLEYVPHDRVIGVMREFVRNGKRHSCDERAYRVYSVLWNFIYPLRCAVNFFVRCARRAFRVFRKKKAQG